MALAASMPLLASTSTSASLLRSLVITLEKSLVPSGSTSWPLSVPPARCSTSESWAYASLPSA